MSDPFPMTAHALFAESAHKLARGDTVGARMSEVLATAAVDGTREYLAICERHGLDPETGKAIVHEELDKDESA